LQDRLSKSNTSSIKDKNLANMLNYLDTMVNISLTNLQDLKSNEILNPTISDTDKKLVNDQIVSFQKNLVEK
jgi:hypothetical protein